MKHKPTVNTNSGNLARPATVMFIIKKSADLFINL